MDIWQKSLESIKNNTDKQTYENWFIPIKFLSLSDNILNIEVPNKFFKDWFCKHYLSLMENTILSITKKNCNIVFSYTDKKTEKIGKSEENKSLSPHNSSSMIEKINTQYTFENFVVGNSNQFAHAASLSVANNPGKNYNPLFIYGGVGLGKTHLLSAIGNFILNFHPNVCYISSESFMNELINSIRYDRMPSFREKFRSANVLLIDDIQFISGKDRTQEEFFHTFNSIYESQKQIVITSDKFPKDIPNLEERLRSRFEWGLIADIQPPEIETKIAILRSKASSFNIPLPDDVAFFLASNVKSNIRELEGHLVRVIAFSSLAETEINFDVAKEALKEVIVREPKVINIDAIQKEVADFYNIKVSDLKSGKKIKLFSLPRQIAMYLCRQLTKSSFPEIGSFFGGKDHSTVIYAVNKIEKLIKTDRQIHDDVNTIKKNLEN